jgi:protein-tyrosine phosphatase
MDPGELIEIATLPNLRDLGGHETTDGGRVRSGLLYRSTDLSRLDDAGIRHVERLGIRTVFDLRTAAEREAHPDRVPAGATRVVADVLADSSGAAPAQLERLLQDPAGAELMFGGGGAVRIFEQGYREIVSLPSALAAYRRFFSDIALAERRPVLFHCTTGKDRTGWAAAATLLLAGVDRDAVLAEYELTNRDLLPQLAPLLNEFEQAGGDPALLRPVLGVDATYLNAALEEMEILYGSIDGYFTLGLGLGAASRQELRDMLVER